MKRLLLGALTIIAIGGNTAYAVEDIIYELCNEAGVCAPVDPATAVIIVAISQLTIELNKEHPFGEHNEIAKAIAELKKALTEGLGENNDIRTFLKQAGITELLQRLGIKL